MKMSNKPKPPTLIEYGALRAYTIDTSLGLVIRNGKSVGTVANDGYYRVSISSGKGKQRGFRRCHIIWWAYHGKWPEQEIDHDNRTKIDDRIDNLLASDRYAQQSNRDFKKSNLPTGVYNSCVQGKPFKAAIQINKKLVLLGNYQTVEDAQTAYMKRLEDIRHQNSHQ